MLEPDGLPSVNPDGSLDVWMLPDQVEVLSWDHEWGAVRGGKGAGKTIGLCMWMLSRMEEYPKAAHFVVGADYEQLRRGAFQSFIDTLTGIGWEHGVDFVYRESPSPMIVIRGSGARLRALGAVQASRIESVEFQSLWLEEPQTWKNGDAVYGILNTRLRHSKRSATYYRGPEGDRPALKVQGRMSFNPPLKGSWLHEVVEKRWAPRGWPCKRVSVRDNYLMLDVAEYIQRLESALPPSQWPSQIDGHWATASGGAIREFDRDVHCDPPEEIPRGFDETKPLLWSLDFNIDYQRSVIAQAWSQRTIYDGVEITRSRPPSHRYSRALPGWQKHVLRYIGEIAPKQSAGTLDVVREFIARFGDFAKRHGGVVLYGDASGGNRSQIDGLASNWSTIIDELTRAGIKFDFQVPAGNGSVVDRIMDLNTQFKSGDGFGATLDMDECSALLQGVENVQWNANGSGLDKGSHASGHDAVDAASYLAVGFRKRIAESAQREYEARAKRDGRDFFAR